MESFPWTEVLTAVLPIVTAVLGSIYVGWRAKVKADEVTDWQDAVVSFVDGLADELAEKVAGEDKPAE
jgi:hypothetical protein